MKNAAKTAIIIVGVVIVGAAGYFVYRKFRSGKGSPKVPGSTPLKDAGAGESLPVYDKYVVQTKNASLNVRKSPDSNSDKVGSISKGSEILAKASGVDGWHEYSKDGKTLTGYISSQYISKIV